MARKLRLVFSLDNGKDYTLSLNGARATEELTPAVLTAAANPLVTNSIIKVSGASLTAFKSADIYETTITKLPIE